MGIELPGSLPVTADLLTNAASLVRTRLVGLVTAASANAVVNPAELAQMLPGQAECWTAQQRCRAAW